MGFAETRLTLGIPDRVPSTTCAEAVDEAAASAAAAQSSKREAFMIDVLRLVVRQI
jgi:hypothetical protein